MFGQFSFDHRMGQPLCSGVVIRMKSLICVRYFPLKWAFLHPYFVQQNAAETPLFHPNGWCKFGVYFTYHRQLYCNLSYYMLSYSSPVYIGVNMGFVVSYWLTRTVSKKISLQYHTVLIATIYQAVSPIRCYSLQSIANLLFDISHRINLVRHNVSTTYAEL